MSQLINMSDELNRQADILAFATTAIVHRQPDIGELSHDEEHGFYLVMAGVEETLNRVADSLAQMHRETMKEVSHV